MDNGNYDRRRPTAYEQIACLERIIAKLEAENERAKYLLAGAEPEADMLESDRTAWLVARYELLEEK